MGNRCTIGWENTKLGVYLHWNSDAYEVQAFLDYCAVMGYRDPDEDDSYGVARLVQIMGNALDPVAGLSLGVVDGYHEDWDNGHYTCKGWAIVRQDRPHHVENPVMMPEIDESDVKDMMLYINSCQPDSIRMDKGVMLEKHAEVVKDRLALVYRMRTGVQTAYTKEE